MVKRKGWKFSEEKILIQNYHTATIDELMGMLPNREADSINAKIKRLKKAGKIKGGKTEETISRAYEQRK